MPRTNGAVRFIKEMESPNAVAEGGGTSGRREAERVVTARMEFRTVIGSWEIAMERTGVKSPIEMAGKREM
jgi:selenocysteine lyase/cysteine desulfurase